MDDGRDGHDPSLPLLVVSLSPVVDIFAGSFLLVMSLLLALLWCLLLCILGVSRSRITLVSPSNPRQYRIKVDLVGKGEKNETRLGRLLRLTELN